MLLADHGQILPGRCPSCDAEVTLRSRRSEQCGAVMLFDNISAVLRASEVEQVPSADWVAGLAGLEDQPWGEWKGGKAITPKAVAQLLAPFNIKHRVLRGYGVAQFEDAFALCPRAQVIPLHCYRG
jgi:hypothetical protein